MSCTTAHLLDGILLHILHTERALNLRGWLHWRLDLDLHTPGDVYCRGQIEDGCHKVARNRHGK